jgi:hypothetical protein
VDYRKLGAVAAGVISLGAGWPKDEVLVESTVLFDGRSAVLAPASASSLDRLVLRVKAIAPEMVSSSGWFRDEEPEVVEVVAGGDSLAEARAEAVKHYLVSRGLDPYRVRVTSTGGMRAGREVSVRLVTLVGQKSFGAPGKAGLRFSR